VPGAKVKVDRILRGGRSVTRDADKSQIGLPVTVKIRDRKLSGAKRNGRPNEAGDGAIRISYLRVPGPEGCEQAENGESRKKDSVGEAAHAHSDNSVYRTLPRGWQSAAMARFALSELRNPHHRRGGCWLSGNVFSTWLTYGRSFPPLGMGFPEYADKVRITS
jgi:hypothetical protein